MPSPTDASQLAARLRRAGGVTASCRATGRGPPPGAQPSSARAARRCHRFPDLAAVVVLDGHDDAHVAERAPTWNAWVVAAERARRAGVPCVVVSPAPTLELLQWGTLVTPSRTEERAGWPPLEVIDRRADDPRTGLYSERLVSLLRERRRVLCILNRKGRATLLRVPCAASSHGAKLRRADGPSRRRVWAVRRCARRARPSVCLACGANTMKRLRPGSRACGEELEAWRACRSARSPPTATTFPTTRCWSGPRRSCIACPDPDAVVFLDFDQELLAARISAGEHALGLLARAGRAVGGRRRQGPGGRPDTVAGSSGDRRRAPRRSVPCRPTRTRRALGAAACRRSVRWRWSRVRPRPSSSTGSGHADRRRHPRAGRRRVAVRAADHQTLCDALAAVPRARPGRLRIEVDPRRV